MVNIGTFIYLIFFAYPFTKRNTLKSLFLYYLVLTAVTELLLERGYFVAIGGIQISYNLICELLLSIVGLIIQIKESKTSKSYFQSSLLLVASIVIGLLFLVFFPTGAVGSTFETSWEEIMTGSNMVPIRFNSGMILEIYKLITYIIIGSTLYSAFSQSDFEICLQNFVKTCSIILIINTAEIITKYLFHSNIYTDVLSMVFGVKEGSFNNLYMRDAGYSLWGGTQEASHYAFVLCILFIFYYGEYHFKFTEIKKQKIQISLCIILVSCILMMSFSCIYYALCIALLFYFLWASKRSEGEIIKSLFTVSVFVITLVIIISNGDVIIEKLSSLDTNNFFSRRLASLGEELKILFNGQWLLKTTALEWSNRVRLGSTFYTLSLLKYRPLVGLGFSSVCAHSSLAMLVSGCGIIGSFLYLKLFFWPIRYLSGHSRRAVSCCCFIYLIINLFNSMSLRPFYEVWTILLMYCFLTRYVK